MDNKFYYKCCNCGKEYPAKGIIYLCEKCAKENNTNSPPKGVLHTLYQYDKILNNRFKNKAEAFNKLKANLFLDILPVSKKKYLPKLKVGNTPLYKIKELNKENLPFDLFLKDDSQNPSYSFKDRASYIVSAFAKENKIDRLVTASTGNAGSSLAGICAAQNQKAIILVPETAPVAKLSQILMYGARLVPVKGNYDSAFDLSIEASKKFAWYNRNTAYNPLTIEGKKTVAFELFEQLDYSVPDKIFVPVGDGVIISGVYKGFEDLMKLKIIEKMPVIVAVQSLKSDNLVRNIANENFELKKSNTIADSISVDLPRNFYMTKKYIKMYEGEYLSITDDEILAASKLLSENTGLFAEPASAAAFAGFIHYYKQNLLAQNSKNIVLLTGSGLKDLQSVQKILNKPKAIEANIEELEQYFLKDL